MRTMTLQQLRALVATCNNFPAETPILLNQQHTGMALNLMPVLVSGAVVSPDTNEDGTQENPEHTVLLFSLYTDPENWEVTG